jgi:myo-inositol-1(or 4)-monophosphatase
MLAAELLEEAGRSIVLPLFGKVEAEEKAAAQGYREHVTAADRAASSFILKVLRQRLPGSFSEEEIHADRLAAELLWQVDPLDGTDEFLSGMGDGYAIQAALLARDGDGWSPIAGIVHQPALGTTWRTDEAFRARFISAGREVPRPAAERASLRGTVRAVDEDPLVKTVYSRIGEALGVPARAVSCGGSGATFAALLEGRVNLVVLNLNYSKEWDLAMGEALVRAAGGWVCDLEGRDYTYNRKDHFNRSGYVASLVWRREEILSHLGRHLIVDRLGGR